MAHGLPEFQGGWPRRTSQTATTHAQRTDSGQRVETGSMLRISRCTRMSLPSCAFPNDSGNTSALPWNQPRFSFKMEAACHGCIFLAIFTLMTGETKHMITLAEDTPPRYDVLRSTPAIPDTMAVSCQAVTVATERLTTQMNLPQTQKSAVSGFCWDRLGDGSSGPPPIHSTMARCLNATPKKAMYARTSRTAQPLNRPQGLKISCSAASQCSGSSPLPPILHPIP
ncbi:hypothetical protein BC835DRAFT_723471 [Cytidiella melzeri]|nr:hypothetical protein BC835DRAFT_723471 [Cytidiella melzeri]